MRSIIKRWLASVLMAWVVLAGASVAQPPGQKEGPPKVFVQPPRIGVEEIVERLMAFDKNKDGKLTKDELPERMHHLIPLGDTNKDGALDKDEIRKLATSVGGFGGRVEGQAFGRRLERDGGLVGLFGPGPGDIEGVVDDLKLSAKKKDQAMAAVKAHKEIVRKLMDEARGEMMQKMREILSEEELKDFRAALDRPRGLTVINVAPRETSKGGVERKLDQPPK